MSAKVHKIRVALKMPHPVGTFIARATNIVDTMVANAATFPSPPVAFTIVTTAIGTLNTAEAAVKSRTVGAAATRDSARQQVAVYLGQLQAYVEQLINADPTDADVIAGKAAMTVTKLPTRSKPDLAAKPVVSGQVKLVAKALKGGKANEWQYSTDGGKTWVDTPVSTKATTTIGGLTVGTTVSFRHRAVTKAGPQDWGQPISSLIS